MRRSSGSNTPCQKRAPTLRQRELGARLRQLRNELGWTVEDVSEKLLCSPTKISRMETAARRPSLRDARDLCALDGVDEPAPAEMLAEMLFASPPDVRVLAGGRGPVPLGEDVPGGGLSGCWRACWDYAEDDRVEC
jgi:transcriptional regulator with XRE-family HTH domain